MNDTYQQHSAPDEEINWDAEGGVVPVGRYDAEIAKVEYKTTKNNKHMLSVQFKIIAAHDPETAKECENKSVFENFVVAQGAAFRMKEFLEATGIAPPSPITKLTLEDWGASIMGTQVTINVKHRIWEDSPRANIAKFLPYGTVAAEEGEEGDGEEEDETEAQEEAPAPKPSLKAATQARNGHANGSTNGAGAKKKAAAPAPKSNKPQARR